VVIRDGFYPAIQKMIVEGNAPESMTLTKLFQEIPANWENQIYKLGLI
jgi:hypothetical protein